MGRKYCSPSQCPVAHFLWDVYQITGLDKFSHIFINSTKKALLEYRSIQHNYSSQQIKKGCQLDEQ
jgi:hypothetical protein